MQIEFKAAKGHRDKQKGVVIQYLLSAVIFIPLSSFFPPFGLSLASFLLLFSLFCSGGSAAAEHH